MNYTDLQAKVIDDSHKLQYTGAIIQEMIARAEGLISSKLESFNFIAQLTDANRVSVGSSTYNLPARLSHLRYVKIDGRPLDKVDETNIYLYKNLDSSQFYVQRATQIEIAGNPALTKVIDIDYMGMPAPLSVTPTNTLLDEFPHVYIDATVVYVYRRAENLELAGAAMQSFQDTIRELNRRSKKLLGGAQSAPAYNTYFRSAY